MASPEGKKFVPPAEARLAALRAGAPLRRTDLMRPVKPEDVALAREINKPTLEAARAGMWASGQLVDPRPADRSMTPRLLSTLRRS